MKSRPKVSTGFYTSRFEDDDSICPYCANRGYVMDIQLDSKKDFIPNVYEYSIHYSCPVHQVLDNDEILIPVSYDKKSKYGITYKINNEGFRSDDFTTLHHGKHILFAGCSNTYGDGLEYNETWAHMLYSKISKNEQLSGYFNLGLIGGKISQIISNIFTYGKLYAKPDVIFFLAPTASRELYQLEDHSKLDTKDKGISFLFKAKAVFDAYLSLEEYCKANDILLITRTWDNRRHSLVGTKRVLSEFATFYDYDEEKEYIPLINDFIRNNRKIDRLWFAEDGVHSGLAQNHADSELFYKIYLESK